MWLRCGWLACDRVILYNEQIAHLMFVHVLCFLCCLSRGDHAGAQANLTQAMILTGQLDESPLVNLASIFGNRAADADLDEAYSMFLIVHRIRNDDAVLLRAAMQLPIIPSSVHHMLHWRRRFQLRLDVLEGTLQLPPAPLCKPELPLSGLNPPSDVPCGIDPDTGSKVGA